MTDKAKLLELLSEAEYGLSAFVKENLAQGNEEWIEDLKTRIRAVLDSNLRGADHE
jgi:hypothetical protein